MLPCLVFDSESGKYGYGLPIPGAWCVPMVFAPQTSPEVVAIMSHLAKANGWGLGSEAEEVTPARPTD